MNIITYFDNDAKERIKVVIEKDGLIIELTNEEAITLAKEILPR
jgi:hypothetical protein